MSETHTFTFTRVNGKQPVIREGYMPFMGFQTYYRTVGEGSPDKIPLILLHGGPGSSHNYFEVLDSLADDGRMLVMYDQLGCGNSPAPGRTDLFNREVWVQELMAIREYLGLERVFLLGQSWGGMLLLEYVCGQHPQGVAGIILASTLPDSQLWGREQRRMIRELPEDMQQAIAEADVTGDYSSPAYCRANEEFMLRHCSPSWTPEDPECFTRPKGSGREAYMTAWGPNEFSPLGNLKDFNRTADLSGITCPALITSGVNDLCTPLIAKTMYDRIPHAAWELFEHSRHMAFAEENVKYTALLRKWMEEQDRK